MNRITIPLIFFIIPILLQSQDYHYWAEQFGARSSLMGGAVIAGVNDNTAIFYNPGGLGFLEGSSISVDANIYKAQFTRFSNVLGQDYDIHYNRYTYYPQLLSGMLNFIKDPDYKLGFILLTRYNSRLLFHERIIGELDAMEDIPGNESYIGSFDYSNEFLEQWGGIGISRRFSEKLSLGITTFVSYRYQSFRSEVAASAIPVEDSVYYISSISESQEIIYVNWKLFWKLGMSMRFGNWKLGLTFTTPTINLYGDADVQGEVIANNLRVLPGNDFRFDFMAVDRQEYLPMHYKNPASIGFGLEYSGEKTSIELAAEYYFRIKPYDIIDPETRYVVYPQSLYNEATGEIKFLEVKGWANDVLNLGIGWQQYLSGSLDFLMGFRTDFNYFNDQYENYQEGIIMYGRPYDIYHLTAGLALKQKQSQITAGLEYTLGFTNNMRQLVDFAEPEENLGLVGDVENNTRVRDHGIAFVIGFTYYFNKALGDFKLKEE
ncbi:MAG: hypothetical protein KKA81_08995 [Bacteroidetes bacterium]|nr:hypothetical protein [Bacteroidota bacterium]